MKTSYLLCIGLNKEKRNKLGSMEREVTESLEETVALDVSMAVSLKVSNEEAKHGDVANTNATNNGDGIDTSTTDKDRNRSKDPTFTHFQKSSKEYERAIGSNSGDKNIVDGDENDLSVSSISSGEDDHAHRRTSGYSDQPQLINADRHRNLTCDDSALVSKREYNRQNAARARKRAKTQLQNLQQQVQALNMSIAQLKERNIALQQTVQTLKEQNALLAQNEQSIEGSKTAAPSNANAASSLFPANSTASNSNIDSTLQTTLLQLLLATATSPSTEPTMQQSQPTLSIQQQTLYYWLLSQLLQQPQSNNMVQQMQSQSPSPVQPIQVYPTPPANTSDQLMALLLSQVQSGNSSRPSLGTQPGGTDGDKNQSMFFPTSRGAQPPPK